MNQTPDSLARAQEPPTSADRLVHVPHPVRLPRLLFELIRARFAVQLLPLLLCFGLAACSSDDTDPAPVTELPEAGEAGNDASIPEEAPSAVDASDAAPDISEGSDADASVDAWTETSGDDAPASTCKVGGVAGECIATSECSAQAEHASAPGYCPGPDEIQCCTPYGKALCDPDVPKNPNASQTVEAPGKDGCPAGMLRVADFCIDQFEASLVRVSDGGAMSPYENPGDTPARAVSVKGAVPQGYVTQEQASSACSNAGKRLCTDDEWLRACQGPSGTTYPYGDKLQLGECNDHRDAHPVVQYFGTDESWIWSELGNACINQLPESLEPSGSRPGCVTAEGAFDMMGNLHEWTADPNGTFRGGFYVDTVLNGPGCLYATTAHNTLHWDYSTGFRCCQ